MRIDAVIYFLKGVLLGFSRHGLKQAIGRMNNGLPGMLGTAGVLILAKDRRLIAAVKPSLDALIENRFFLSRSVDELILNRAGES